MAETYSILFVDAYDSFSENIKALLDQTCLADITTIKVDTDVVREFHTSLTGLVSSFSAIVLGPGPGDPRNGAKDTGIFDDILESAASCEVPVLGICLGFQTICLRYGLSLQCLPEPCHGHAKRILPLKAHRLFEGIGGGNICATCYNSLGVQVSSTPRDIVVSRPGSASTNASFGSSSGSIEVAGSDLICEVALEMLASDEDGYLMATAHRTLPFYGFQFHPESCKSNSYCHDLIRNWFELVVDHNRIKRKKTYPSPAKFFFQGGVRHQLQVQRLKSRGTQNGQRLSRGKPQIRQLLLEAFLEATQSSGSVVSYRQSKTKLSREEISARVQKLSEGSNMVMLESTKKGRFNIYALPRAGPVRVKDTGDARPKPSQLSFSVRDGKITSSCLQKDPQGVATSRRSQPVGLTRSLPSITLNADTADILTAIENFLSLKRATEGSPEVPFWGGFMGFMSYEMGLAQLGVDLGQHTSGSVDDMSLVWVERSLIYDSLTSTITVQSLVKEDSQFLDDTLLLLQDESDHSDLLRKIDVGERLEHVLHRATFELPDRQEYNHRYDLCQQNLRAGNSYELCLTTEAKVFLPDLDDDLVHALYRNMHAHNPVPFGAFLDLENVTILSTSPEEFMSWDRSGTIDMRPMKGTVKRSPSMTLAKATEILSTPKESAENLMIADLIRHDLYSALGYRSKVEIVKLCGVIEHETVYQLVSHIQASAPIEKSLPQSSKRQMAMHYGFKALTTSLPPGSMTGAPKKRSCQILGGLESRDRGVYSGVIGYLDVGGGGAWNVCIRTAFRVKDGTDTSHLWRVGAGGAITVLSDKKGEWEEMQTKLSSVLRGFTTVQ